MGVNRLDYGAPFIKKFHNKQINTSVTSRFEALEDDGDCRECRSSYDRCF